MVLPRIVLGQSDKPAVPAATFHVAGTIDDRVNAVIPNAEVHFVGDSLDLTVSTDGNGFYQTDLPVGTYTMTVVFRPLAKYIHFFRVRSPMRVTLNGTLMGGYSCDLVWTGNDEEEQEEFSKDHCGGEDLFQFPSRDGVPLRLEIRYVRRTRGKLVSYSSSGIVRCPVLVAYNLFALQADSVDYNRTDGTLRAYGHVVIEDQLGRINATSAAFKFDDGKATRIW